MRPRQSAPDEPIMRPTNTAITLACIALAIAAWLGTRTVQASTTVQIAVLLGLGVILPLVITESREPV